MAEAEASLDGGVEGLSGAQEVALAALRGGGTFVRAAQEAGVSRMTVYRWLRGNPHFRAAFNAWQQEATESARARLVKLADQAVDVVERALGRDDEKVALKVLRGVGVLRKRGGGGGSTDPEVLNLQMQLREKRELRRAEMAMLRFLMRKAGMRAQERRRVLAGGRAAAEFMEQVQQESDRRARAAEAQLAGEGDPAEPATTPAGFVPAAEPPDHSNLQERRTEMGGAAEGGSAPVTSQEAVPVSAHEETSRVESCNCIDGNNLGFETSLSEEALGDVTQDVTAEGASHEFRWGLIYKSSGERE